MMETEELKQEVAEEAVELKETTEKKKRNPCPW